MSAPDDDGPEEFQALAYCYHCCRRLNQPDDPSTQQAEPQVCRRCAQEDSDRA